MRGWLARSPARQQTQVSTRRGQEVSATQWSATAIRVGRGDCTDGSSDEQQSNLQQLSVVTALAATTLPRPSVVPVQVSDGRVAAGGPQLSQRLLVPALHMVAAHPQRDRVGDTIVVGCAPARACPPCDDKRWLTDLYGTELRSKSTSSRCGASVGRTDSNGRRHHRGGLGCPR